MSTAKSGAKLLDLGLRNAYDELFMDDQGRAENRLPKIYTSSRLTTKPWARPTNPSLTAALRRSTRKQRKPALSRRSVRCGNVSWSSRSRRLSRSRFPLNSTPPALWIFSESRAPWTSTSGWLYLIFHGLGAQLKPAGLLVITDTMLNRVTVNWKKGKRTHVFIDKFHVVFENEFSAEFFNSAWRQFRKRNAYPTAITQNVEYLLDSVQASTMLSNSEFIVMLNQAAQDREKLSRLLNISNEQMSYITNADAGCGLIKYGSALVLFINRFPKDTKLYELMTTRPGEGKFAQGQA